MKGNHRNDTSYSHGAWGVVLLQSYSEAGLLNVFQTSKDAHHRSCKPMVGMSALVRCPSPTFYFHRYVHDDTRIMLLKYIRRSTSTSRGSCHFAYETKIRKNNRNFKHIHEPRANDDRVLYPPRHTHYTSYPHVNRRSTNACMVASRR